MPLDAYDRTILRLITEYCADEEVWLTTNDIAEQTGLNWKTVYSHLNNLVAERFVIRKVTGERKPYTRAEKEIIARTQIRWTLNVRRGTR